MPKRNRAVSAPNEETLVPTIEPVDPVNKTAKKGRTLSQATAKKAKKTKPSRKLGRVRNDSFSYLQASGLIGAGRLFH